MLTLPILHNMAFQSTPLMRGETIKALEDNLASYISIHSPHARGDQLLIRLQPLKNRFQSTPLMRGETRCARYCSCDRQISIHSPHARGDTWKAI